MTCKSLKYLVKCIFLPMSHVTSDLCNFFHSCLSTISLLSIHIFIDPFLFPHSNFVQGEYLSKVRSKSQLWQIEHDGWRYHELSRKHYAKLCADVPLKCENKPPYCTISCPYYTELFKWNNWFALFCEGIWTFSLFFYFTVLYGILHIILQLKLISIWKENCCSGYVFK